MDIKLLKKIGIISASSVIGFYSVFLITPIFLTGIINSYVPQIEEIIDNSTGLKSEITEAKIVTTPKLTVGLKVKNFKLKSPTDDEIFNCDNFNIKMSLLPILLKKIELDSISGENISTNLKIQKNGKFLIENYLPKSNKNENPDMQTEPVMLPLGIKLSNQLPNISIKNYEVKFIDIPTNDIYSISGNKAKISDFILDKHIKINADGKITLKNNVQFNYNVKIFNKIMPNMNLNDLVFASSTEKTETKPVNFNIIDFFKAIYTNKLTADVTTNLTTYGKTNNININGNFDIENFSIAVDGTPLPAGSIIMKFKKNKIDLISKLHTSKTDFTEVIGDFKIGKHPKIDLTCQSKAKLKDLIDITDSIAKSFGYHDLDTLTATGQIDADFNLKSNLKKISSSGHFKVLDGSLNYALYNILIKNILVNIDFSNNMIDIKNSGLTILNQPLKFYGTIQQNSTTDLHVTADRLPIKGLLLATGQFGLLKENQIHGGTLSMDTSIKGKLNKPEPKVKLNINNINIKNIPSNTSVTNKLSTVNISTDGKTFDGKVNISNAKIINPMATISVPNSKISFGSNDIIIDKSYLLLNNSKINFSGAIKNYAKKNISLNILANGNLLSNDLKNIIPKDFRKDIKATGEIPLAIAITGNDKTQDLNIKLTSNPTNYLSYLDIDNLKNKNTILNSKINLSNDTIKLSDTGIFVNSLNNPILTIKGSIHNISKTPTLSSLNINTPSIISMAIPDFKGSKITTKANVTVNGNINNPTIKGEINLPSISIPTIKTLIKNTVISLNSNFIHINCPNIAIDNSKMNGSLKMSPNFNHGVIINSMDFNSNYLDADTLGKALEKLPQTTTATSNSTTKTGNSDLGITLYNGKGTISKFKSGGIVAENLTSDFNLKNNTIYLNNISGTAFSGKVSGKISYNIINSKIGIDFKGSDMNATTAIEGAGGIKNAMSGKLGFDAKLNLKGLTEAEMMKTLTGKVNFNINNGVLGSIGKLDSFIKAQNVTSNSILNATVNSIALLPTIQKTANFKEITGNLTLGNGWANLTPLKMSGQAMSYYVTGKYNLLTGYTNLTVLGRLSADVVSILGPLGDLSISKLTSYIPKFGVLTGNLLNALTTNPKGEHIELIPALTGGETNYKDFKVIINGNIESAKAVKSFKWLSTCDTSAIEKINIKEQIQTTKKAITETTNAKINEAKEKLEAARTQAQQTTQQTKNSINNLKDLKNLNENLKNLLK